MRLVSFEVGTPLGPFARLGALLDESVVDLNLAAAARLARLGRCQPRRLADALLPADMLAFLDGGPDALAEAGRALDFVSGASGEPLAGPRGERVAHRLGEVRLLAPLQPRSLRDFFAYEDHALKAWTRAGAPLPAAWYDQPIYFKGNHREIYGPDQEVPWPSYTRRFDFEAEVACVVGKAGRDLAAADAAAHIAGFTILNDFSARDVMKSEFACGMGPAKGKDFAYGLGPYLVTADEAGPEEDLEIQVRVNGELWSRGRTGRRYWSWGLMLSHVSQEETLLPGDVLGSGTFFRGCGLDLERWVKPGDEIELRVDKLGALRHTVGRPKAQTR
ncbi:MAG: fumarylacetoacetate hydrolase family protein, partial [Elusimicrobia bacterium]|nr:fumarylacetoacetate hydrolase family protein [Elusimicrobiota bacterium]